MLLLENKDFRAFIGLLNSNGVRFLIVGGHAVTFHGSPRFTADLDLWVATDPENTGRIGRVLMEFGFGKMFRPDDFLKPGYAIQLGRPPFRIDILTSIDGVEFAGAYERRKALRSDGVVLPFIGLDDLVANKRTVGRLHDLDDAKKLARVSRGAGRASAKKQRRRT